MKKVKAYPWVSARPTMKKITHAKVGRRKSVRGRDSGGGGGVGVEGVDVGQEGGHDGRNPRTQVLGGQAMEVSGGGEK